MDITERDHTLLVLAAESSRLIPTRDSEKVTFLRKAFSPAATRTAQKRHPAEKLSPLLWSNSATPQARPSETAIVLKAFCKKEVAWPEGTHYPSNTQSKSALQQQDFL